MISAIVLTKNEEKNILKCLNSLSWCDEIIVIDDNSTDKTVEIAKKTKARVYSRSLNNDFSKQRNFGLDKATGEWVLFVDADEIVSSALWYEVMQYTNDPINNYTGFFLKRTDVMWGQELIHGETGTIKFLRLAKKDAGIWEGKVHEIWNIQGKTKTLNNPLMHYPHKNIKKFLEEINFYTDLRAKDLYENKVKASSYSIIIFPTGKFIQNYIFKQGFRDGIAGLLFALMMSFHSFLVRSKLWYIWQS